MFLEAVDRRSTVFRRSNGRF